MDHIAIMRKSWGLLPRILSGEKTVESRFYKNRSAPWNKIQKGEIVYFKNSGEAVTLKAKVKDVMQFEDLDEEKIYKLRKRYRKEIGISREELDGFKEFFIGKKYGILIFLTYVRKIEPFNIDKRGFGSNAAWLCVQNVDTIRLK